MAHRLFGAAPSAGALCMRTQESCRRRRHQRAANQQIHNTHACCCGPCTEEELPDHGRHYPQLEELQMGLFPLSVGTRAAASLAKLARLVGYVSGVAEHAQQMRNWPRLDSCRN